MESKDQLKKFLLQDRSARVITTSIQTAWQKAQEHHTLSEPVRQLLGELVGAATLLAANLKFDGALLLQLQGQGAVKLIVVECRADLSMRATVKLRRDPQANETSLQTLLNADQSGRFSVILNPPRDNPGRQPYQGVVPLSGETVAEVLEDYMRQSEQLDTRIWLSSDSHRVAGLLLQRMPQTGGQSHVVLAEAQASWENAETICNTLTKEELLSVPIDMLLHRLFWESPVVGLESHDITWHCGCQRARVAGMLRSLGQAEVDDIIREQGDVTVTCEFCGTPYRFDAVDAAGLFEEPMPDPGDSLH